MFKTIDLDGNGTIDYTEFVMATVNEAKIMTTDRLEMAFKQFDADGNGSLSPDEIKDYLYFKETIHSEEIDKIIEDADENGDGEIQFPEFCAMMKNLNAKVSII
jgi:calcium-dependent protein kinase